MIGLDGGQWLIGGKREARKDGKEDGMGLCIIVALFVQEKGWA